MTSQPLPDHSGYADLECSCAMTEASMWACEVHGLDGDEDKLATWERQRLAAYDEEEVR